jgi:hypothetical protein
MRILCHVARNLQRFPLFWPKYPCKKKKGGGHTANRPQFFTVGRAYQLQPLPVYGETPKSVWVVFPHIIKLLRCGGKSGLRHGSSSIL